MNDDRSFGSDARQLLEHAHVGSVEEPQDVGVVLLLIANPPITVLLQRMPQSGGRIHERLVFLFCGKIIDQFSIWPTKMAIYVPFLSCLIFSHSSSSLSSV